MIAQVLSANGKVMTVVNIEESALGRNGINAFSTVILRTIDVGADRIGGQPVTGAGFE